MVVNETAVHIKVSDEGKIVGDIYKTGDLVGSFGPFFYYEYGYARITNDGNMSILTWKNKDKKAFQVVVIGADGKIRYQVDCGEDAADSYPVGDKGVLIAVGHEEPTGKFRYYQPDGQWIFMDIGPNANPIATLPGSCNVLFRTNTEDNECFKLVDCVNGKTLWDIASPVQYIESPGKSSAVVVDDIILIMGQNFAAVEIMSGKTISQYNCEEDVSRFDRRRLVRIGSRLYGLTRDEFYEINLADIYEKGVGWFPPRK